MMTQQHDPLSEFRINKQTPPKTLTTPAQPLANDPLAEFRIKTADQPESYPRMIARNATRIASRVGEAIGGLPGEISELSNLIQSGTFDFLENLTGKKIDKEKAIQRVLPTTKELKQKSEELTGGYTKAQGPLEETIDEYTSTVASLLGPMKFTKALGIAALGTGAKKTAELAGLGEGSQEAAKLGTMFISSMINPGGVKKYYRNLFNEAEKLVPKGATVAAKPLEIKLNNLKASLSQGLGAPSEEAVLKTIDKTLAKIKNGRVEVKEMIASNRSLNEIMGDPELLSRAESLYPQLKKAIVDSIKLYKDPQVLKTWKSANEAYSGLVQSQATSRWMNKVLGNKPIKHVLLASIAETASGHPEAILPTIGAATAGYMGVKGVEMVHRMFSNPTLKKYYQEAILNAAKQNTPAFLKSVDHLEKALNNQDGHHKEGQKDNP